MKKLFKKTKGFTLIELIVVIAILAILAAILIPSITNYITQANNSKDLANARSIYSEITLANNSSATDITATTYKTCTITYSGTLVTSVQCGTQTYTPS